MESFVSCFLETDGLEVVRALVEHEVVDEDQDEAGEQEDELSREEEEFKQFMAFRAEE